MSLIGRLFNGVADLVIARPAQVLLVMALLFLASFVFMENLSMDSGSDIILAADDPSMMWYTVYTNEYTSEKVILLYISAPTPLDYTFLHDLQVMEEELSRIPGVVEVQTVADAISTANGGTLPHTDAEINAIFSQFPKSTQTELVPDSIHVLGMITAEGDPTSLLTPIQSVTDNAVLPPGVLVEISGSDAFNQQMLDTMTEQIVVLILGAFSLMFIGLFILFGSVRYRLLPLFFVLIGMVYLFGFLGACRISLNIGAIGGFPVLLGLGIDYAVQFQSRLNDELLTSSLEDAIRTTICNTGYAVLNAMAATAIGFMVLFITPLPILTGFTQTAIVGIICAYGATLFGFPALAILMHYKPKIPSSGGFD
ncbi:MAG: MMPL family transporter, partial [Methanospirillum sp.]|nr:MMPL family transporter [Methanospirillum sp.]